MSAGICFYFEPNHVDVYSGRKIDLDTWNYAVKAAGDIDRMIVVNRTNVDLMPPDTDMDFQVVEELPDLENSVKVCCPWIEGNVISLWDFDHEVDWYLFGPANGWNSPVQNGVTIPTSGPAFHSVHAASVILSHRYKVVQWQ